MIDLLINFGYFNLIMYFNVMINNDMKKIVEEMLSGNSSSISISQWEMIMNDPSWNLYKFKANHK
jgi:hypothetical protein